MSLLARLRAAAPSAIRETRIVEGVGQVTVREMAETKEERRFSGGAVRPSADLTRIETLPRRATDPEEDAQLARKWTALLAKQPTQCSCVKRWGFCLREFKPIQGRALEELHTTGGLLGPIGVGHGKTAIVLFSAMVVPNCKVAVLLIPSQGRLQMARDYEQWSVHFRTPNLAGGRLFVPGLPSIYIVAYSELSSAKSTDLLRHIGPDLIVADEAHSISRTQAARTKRFRRCMQEPKPRFVALSGTLTNRSLKDYGHLASYALGQGSPLPLHWGTLEEWAGALDAEKKSTLASPPGALRRLCREGEKTREGFHRRLVETPGVVSTKEGSLNSSLVIAERKVSTPPEILQAIRHVCLTWERPDGEELTDAIWKARLCREIASGFYYRWTWPRRESRETIAAWMEARKNWHREIRKKLEHDREFMDSPLLVTKAAIRWHEGFVHVDPCGNRLSYPPRTKHALTWPAEHWLRWQEVAPSAQPGKETVWLSDYLAKDAAAWAAEAPGIVWYTQRAFGEAIARVSGCPLYGPGEEAAKGILNERGDRSIIASIRAHGEIKNLQAFSRNLMANVPSSAKTWEQTLGRTHRQGQKADEVTCDVYRCTAEMIADWEAAVRDARYGAETMGTAQKILTATINWE